MHTAREAYETRIEQVKDLLEKIASEIDLQSAVENPNWAHAGSMDKMSYDLAIILRFLKSGS